MLHIAIAGGSSPGLGVSLTASLLAAGHKITILSRSLPNNLSTNANLHHAAVDYNSVSSVAVALKGVHTLISVIWSLDNIVEINRVLIDGAVQAGVKRCIPSEWSGREKCNELIDWYHPRVAITELIESSGLEWTAVRIGLFMNYLAVGSVHEKEALGGLRSQNVVIDMKNGTAEVPGTGDEKLGLIRVEDVGTVVAKIVEIDGKWEKEYLITGDMTTYNQILKVAEDITGHKFEVKYTPIEEFQDEANEPKPKGSGQAFLWQFKKCVAEGDIFGYQPSEINEKALGLVNTREFITKWWGQ